MDWPLPTEPPMNAAAKPGAGSPGWSWVVIEQTNIPADGC
jgi:hypothetical protein